MGAIALIAVAAAVVGALVGRWMVAIPVTLAWIVYSVGLDLGWWGNGVGDGWVAAAALGALAATLGATAGVALRPSVTRYTRGHFRLPRARAHAHQQKRSRP